MENGKLKSEKDLNHSSEYIEFRHIELVGI